MISKDLTALRSAFAKSDVGKLTLKSLVLIDAESSLLKSMSLKVAPSTRVVAVVLATFV